MSHAHLWTEWQLLAVTVQGALVGILPSGIQIPNAPRGRSPQSSASGGFSLSPARVSQTGQVTVDSFC